MPKPKFLILTLILCLTLTACSSGKPKPDAEEVLSYAAALADEYPEDAVSTLEAYVYQHTGDYNPVSQAKAERAFEALREYLDSVRDALNDIDRLY